MADTVSLARVRRAATGIERAASRAPRSERRAKRLRETAALAGDTARRVDAFVSRPRQLFKWKDPELMKALYRTAETLSRLERKLGEAAAGANQPRTDLRSMRALIGRVTTRTWRDAAWEVHEQLRLALLPWLSQAELRALVIVELDRANAASPRAADSASPARAPVGHPALWQRALDVLDAGGTTEAVELLSSIQRDAIEDNRHERAVGGLRFNYMIVFTLILILTLAGAALCAWYDQRGLVSVMAGGALGAHLAGIFKFREMRELRVLRNHATLSFLQPFVGVASALVVTLAFEVLKVRSEGLEITTTPARLLFGFVAGFSEPFFLGVVGKVATLGPSAQPPR